MMHGKKANNLIVIENGILTTYHLDDKKSWELGRPSRDNFPDIKMRSVTVSRKHGKFQNMDGVWFYLDYNGKNGTVYNRKHLSPGINGRMKPILLSDGDTFVFGGAQEAVISCKTVWAIYVTKDFDEQWRVVDSKGLESVKIGNGLSVTELTHPDKGTVIEQNDGMAIYMGDLIYLMGNMELVR